MSTFSFSYLFLWKNWLRCQHDSVLFIATVAVLFFSMILYILAIKSRQVGPPLPPGPRGLPIVGSLPFLNPELHTYFAALGHQYGPIMTIRLGGTVGILISSPAQAREVLKDHDVTFANRDIIVASREATYGGADIAWSPYGPTWRMLRKVCVRDMLSPATLDSVYTLRRAELRQFIRYLDSRVQNPVNIGEQMFLTLMNVITGMLWGGTVKGEQRESLGLEFQKVVMEMTELMGKPNLSDFFPSIARFDVQGIEKQMKGLVKRFDKIFVGIIDQRLRIDKEGEGESNKDFLQVLLKLKDEEDSKTPSTMTHVKALLMDMVVGGTETTSNTVEFALAEMMNKPQVMQKAQQELEKVVGKGNVVEESHITKLPYLYAVMKETLRLHPALPLLVPHCPSQTSVIGGYTVPKGARVFINAWAIHRDPTIWENPLDFDPGRFLDSKWDYSGNDFDYFPFGSGRRICAGTAMAERMFMYSLASLVHSFDWKVPEGEKLDLEEKFGIVLKKKAPLVVIPLRRLSDDVLYE